MKIKDLDKVRIYTRTYSLFSLILLRNIFYSFFSRYLLSTQANIFKKSEVNLTRFWYLYICRYLFLSLFYKAVQCTYLHSKYVDIFVNRDKGWSFLPISTFWTIYKLSVPFLHHCIAKLYLGHEMLIWFLNTNCNIIFIPYDELCLLNDDFVMNFCLRFFL